MKREKDEVIITLSDLWYIFLESWLPILLATVLCTGLAVVYGKVILTPKYASTATLYILRQDGSSDYVITQSDLTIATNIVSDCSYMVKSREVLEEVIEEENLSMSYSDLKGAISINNPDKTRILEVTVSTTDPELSKQIADAVCEKAAAKINDSMKLDQVNIYSYGNVSHAQNNAVSMTKYALVGIATAVLVYFIYFVAFLLDDNIRTEEDVEKYLDLSVIATVPNSHGSRKKHGRYGKYGYYKGYGYGYGYGRDTGKNAKSSRDRTGTEDASAATEEAKK